ncbi:hypothetical protein J6590_054461 [Homalodisca vitripennis]|nr:hypothetical protein J6590_054461 [Homalodisca vitripennis]
MTSVARGCYVQGVLIQAHPPVLCTVDAALPFFHSISKDSRLCKPLLSETQPIHFSFRENITYRDYILTRLEQGRLLFLLNSSFQAVLPSLFIEVAVAASAHPIVSPRFMQRSPDLTFTVQSSHIQLDLGGSREGPDDFEMQFRTDKMGN